MRKIYDLIKKKKKKIFYAENNHAMTKSIRSFISLANWSFFFFSIIRLLFCTGKMLTFLRKTWISFTHFQFQSSTSLKCKHTIRWNTAHSLRLWQSFWSQIKRNVWMNIFKMNRFDEKPEAIALKIVKNQIQNRLYSFRQLFKWI